MRCNPFEVFIHEKAIYICSQLNTKFPASTKACFKLNPDFCEQLHRKNAKRFTGCLDGVLIHC